MNRLESLRRRMADNGVDAILISQPYNRYYLSGFTGKDSPGGGTAGWLLITQSEASILVGFLSLEQARHECPDFDVVQVGSKPSEKVGEMARTAGWRRLACEGGHLTHTAYLDLASQVPEGCELVAIEGWVEEQRAVKDEDEIAKIRRAAAITDGALAHVVAAARPGITGRELAWEAEKYMREAGAEAMAFEVGFGSGPETSIPHSHPTGRRLKAGEPIWIDMGAQLDGYCSDLTRTFALGEADPKLREIWELVYRAQQAAIRGCRPGMSGGEVDAIARDIIAEAGYGPAFGHSLGHGVGLVVHEGPRLARESKDVLKPGMVVTFEPGVYLEGWGGVRLEDLGVIRESGVELLSAAEKRMVVG
ncbi:MAG: M24 family metallopeptidase [Chloroflexota bacterium]